MPKISEERKEATRRRLLDAAVHVILTEGPAAATTRQILTTAGLSAGALYHYFPSKDDLYEAIAHRFADNDDALPSLPPDATEDDAIAHHCAVIAALFGPGNHPILGELRAASRTSEAIREGLARYDRLVVGRSAANNRVSQSLGLFRSDVDAEALAEMITVFFEGYVMRRPGGFTSGEDRVLRLFVEAVLDRLIDPAHPRAGELRRRILEALP